MDKDTPLDIVIGFVFLALLIGGPLLLIKTNKEVEDTLKKKPLFGCCCFLLSFYVWLCILAVIMSIIFFFRNGYVPGR